MSKMLNVFAAVGLVLVFSSVSQAAVVVGLDQADLLGLTKYGEDPAGQSLSYIAANPDAVYGSMLGDIGFMGTLTDLTAPISSEIMIGSGNRDLTGYDTFEMTLFNDNDDTWTVRLYVDDGGTVVYSSGASLAPGGTTALAMDVTGMGAVDSMGFEVSADRNDTFHISVLVIPEPATIALLGLGGLALLLRRRKKA